jgi:hypothetical protein
MSFYFADGEPTNRADEFLILAMVALSFPSGFLVPLLYGLIASALFRLFGITIRPSGWWYYVHLAITWGAIGALGYLQWFHALPRFVEWRRLRKSSAR